jgi:hypothetical protein
VRSDTRRKHYAGTCGTAFVAAQRNQTWGSGRSRRRRVFMYVALVIKMLSHGSATGGPHPRLRATVLGVQTQGAETGTRMDDRLDLTARMSASSSAGDRTQLALFLGSQAPSSVQGRKRSPNARIVAFGVRRSSRLPKPLSSEYV